ncbi:hypothetical protein [Roseomonas chloroacetimidivorans]|jgi:hypothetical protein|uniref:hypothetical protein n=1 Tax=Roseomonas chloroacetimidivorans TaxID=1766656 RepID=UPI003C780433
MDRDFEQKRLRRATTGSSGLDCTIRATKDRVEYARTQRITAADELLGVLMAALLVSRSKPSHEELLAAEERAINAARLLCKPI